jgi:hypothetical protein
MENESGQHLGNELLGADEDDVVERVPDVRPECTASFQAQAQANIPSVKEGNLSNLYRNIPFLQIRFSLSLKIP